jgi:hypothetical protein
VPCPPELTALLHAHVQEFGLQPDGRLFVGERNGGELPHGDHRAGVAARPAGRVRRRGGRIAPRQDALRPAARGRIDLAQRRRAADHGGRVAGHSVEVLLRTYAKCLDGGDTLIRQRVQAALGQAGTDTATGTR